MPRRSLYRRKPHRQPRRCGWVLRILLVISLALLAVVAIYHLEGYLRTPQAIFVLGGSIERENFTADFAQRYPDLPIWISSGSNPEYSEWVFAQARIAPTRLHLDYQAVDTVTNFTTLVDVFKQRGIDSIYLITSDYHMLRAQVIAEIILGSRDIDFRPISIPTKKPPESFDKALRDGARALLWVTTGHTGSSLSRFFHAG